MNAFFIQYEVHPGEEGWYGYKQPKDPRCRPIRYVGPLKKVEAEKWAERKNEYEP